ncbi:MAG: hypothetical protein B7Z73_07740 [Planctomycetia bacterium 21-64-5]|nr:MAG: hypothetical protein B7Z73_07740 [Planctomycetia bacterium 21-64-5]
MGRRKACPLAEQAGYVARSLRERNGIVARWIFALRVPQNRRGVKRRAAERHGVRSLQRLRKPTGNSIRATGA